MLTVKVQPPRSADVLRKNPLGLYVDAIDWSRELDTPVLSPVVGDALKSLDHFPMPGELVEPSSVEPPPGKSIGSPPEDRKSAESGTRVEVRVERGVRRIFKKKQGK